MPSDTSASPFARLLNNISGSRLDPKRPLPKVAPPRPAQQRAVPLNASRPVAATRDALASTQATAASPAAKVSPFSALANRRAAPAPGPASPRASAASIAAANPAPAAVAPQAHVEADPEHGSPAHEAAGSVKRVGGGLLGRVSPTSAPSPGGAQAPAAAPRQVVDPDAAGVVSRTSGGLLGRVVRTPAPLRAEQKEGFRYSDEQQAVIDCDDQIVVCGAFAGTGKTTTAVGYAAARQREKMLYLVLNAGNAAEARARFPRNVDVMTTHSLAWKQMRSHVGDRISRNWKPASLMSALRISKPRQAALAMAVLRDFFGTPDRDISDKHAEAVRIAKDLHENEVMTAVSMARLAWKRMCDRNDTLEMPDDAYLKMYALTNPQLPYTRIIFDEAQDANPVTMQIVKAQQRTGLLCIGDRHQSIYQFRGSVNAMERFAVGAKNFHLTETRRFGPKIAEIANLILGDLKGETAKIKGMGSDGQWDPRRITQLSRTNAQLFEIAAEVRGEGIHWIGGPKNYRIDLVRDAYHLFAREYSEIRDKHMREAGSWADYANYAEEAMDGEARILVKLVEQYQHDTPQLLDDIVANAVEHEPDASMVLTTAHKSKGLEWDNVKLCDDFEFLADLEFELSQNPNARIPEADVNLLYVAATRAKSAITLNQETQDWIKNLPRHREDRRLAGVRAEQERMSQPLRMGA